MAVRSQGSHGDLCPLSRKSASRSGSSSFARQIILLLRPLSWIRDPADAMRVTPHFDDMRIGVLSHDEMGCNHHRANVVIGVDGIYHHDSVRCIQQTAFVIRHRHSSNAPRDLAYNHETSERTELDAHPSHSTDVATFQRVLEDNT